VKFKVDENLPATVTQLLRQAGHDALSIIDQNLGGESDLMIATICRQEKRAIVTLDMDFADIRTYPPDKHAGIIVLRLRKQDIPSITAVVKRILAVLEREVPDAQLWIVNEQRIRILE
jgi:predicted nuclease of predicted toxin-antitoxin system